MKPITARQQETLDYISNFILKNGYSPTVREIGAGIFIVSHSTVCVLLDHLVDKGFIERTVGKSRSIIVLNQPGDKELLAHKRALTAEAIKNSNLEKIIVEKDVIIKNLERELAYTRSESKDFCASQRDLPR